MYRNILFLWDFGFCFSFSLDGRFACYCLYGSFTSNSWQSFPMQVQLLQAAFSAEQAAKLSFHTGDFKIQMHLDQADKMMSPCVLLESGRIRFCG